MARLGGYLTTKNTTECEPFISKDAEPCVWANRPVAQTPLCPCRIFHNAPFCTKCVTKWCIVVYVFDALFAFRKTYMVTNICAIYTVQKSFRSLVILCGLHGNHQIWNVICRQPNVVAWWKFAWVYPISTSLRISCCLKWNWYNIHIFIT